MIRGYRVLERRYRSPAGEIDLVAVRRRRLAFVEVKMRATRDQAAWSVNPRQRARIARAAEHWLARRPGFHGHEIGFDVMLIAPWTVPQYMKDAFRV